MAAISTTPRQPNSAELYGWVNLALPSSELDEKVNALARRIAALTPDQIAAAKAAVTAALGSDNLHAGLVAEGVALGNVYPAPQRFVEMVRRAVNDGGQSRANELHLEQTLDRAKLTLSTSA